MLADVIASLHKIVSAGHSEATKIRNASYKSLIEEQPLTDDELEKVKKMLEQ